MSNYKRIYIVICVNEHRYQVFCVFSTTKDNKQAWIKNSVELIGTSIYGIRWVPKFEKYKYTFYQKIHTRCKVDAPSRPHGDPRHLRYPQHRSTGYKQITKVSKSSILKGRGTLAPSDSGPQWQSPQYLPQAGRNGKFPKLDTSWLKTICLGLVRVC